MDIIDTVDGWCIEAGMQILLHNEDFDDDEPFEVHSVNDKGISIEVTGFSHLTGGTETYEIDPDGEFDVWAA